MSAIWPFRFLTPTLILGGLLCVCVHGQESPAPGREALEGGIPEVAIPQLRQALKASKTPKANNAVVRRDTVRLLAQALLSAGHDKELVALAKAEFPVGPEREYWCGQAYASQSDWTAAASAFAAAAKVQDNPTLCAQARYGEGEALLALGENAAAKVAFQDTMETDSLVGAAGLRLAEIALEEGNIEEAGSLLAKEETRGLLDTRRHEYLSARLLLAQGQYNDAAEAFQRFSAKVEGLTPSMLAGAAIGLSRARLGIKNTAAAETALEEFIDQYPDLPELDRVFEELDRVYAGQKNPSTIKLRDWSRIDPPKRASLAEFLRASAAIREGDTDRALQLLERIRDKYPKAPIFTETMLRLAEIRLSRRDLAASREVLIAGKARVKTGSPMAAEFDYLRGRIEFAARKFGEASQWFEAAMRLPAFAETGLFNLALSHLEQGRPERFLDDYKKFSTLYPESVLRRELVLEQGLFQIRNGDSAGQRTLATFIRDFPDHPRVPDAQLAIAESSFLSTPSDPEGASRYLRAANIISPENAERAEYLALFLPPPPDAGQAPDTLALAQAFLTAHPDSALIPDVRMKLGELYFRAEDFPQAQTQFELVATENPDSPHAEKALFLAAKASLRTMNDSSFAMPLALFEKAVRMNGPLKPLARLEQARLKTQSGKESEAVLLYDDLLASNPEPELRFAALSGKGETLSAMAARDAKLYPEAIRIFDLLATEARTSPLWRNQALWKKGRCLEKMAQENEALATYYEVLEQQEKSPNQPEFFWLYKAAFDAGRILENRKQWASAIGIYQKLARIPGPRAEEASQRVSRLRLEHFVWEN